MTQQEFNTKFNTWMLCIFILIMIGVNTFQDYRIICLEKCVGTMSHTDSIHNEIDIIMGNRTMRLDSILRNVE